MRVFRLKGLAIIALLLLSPFGSRAQSRLQRVPPSNLDASAPLAPPTWRDVLREHRSYTQVILRTDYSDRMDTSEVFRLRIDPKHKTFTCTTWNYKDISDREFEDLEDSRLIRLAYRSRCGEGSRTIYRYDCQGLLQSQQEAEVYPAGTFYNLYQRFLAFATEQEEKRRFSRYQEEEEEDEVAQNARYKHLFDSFARTRLPELVVLADKKTFRYDTAGNLLYEESEWDKNQHWYHYSRDAAGRVVSRRLAYLSRANEGTFFSGDEFRYHYDSAGRLQKVALYIWEGDSSEAARPAEPVSTETFYVNAAGRTDSLYQKLQNNRIARHYYTYQDSLCIRYVQLEGYATGSVDTIRRIDYRFLNGKQSEEIMRSYNSGLPEETQRTLYFYDKKGRPVELQTFRPDLSRPGSERVSQRDLFFYGDAQDAVTAQRYRPVPVRKKISQKLPRPRKPQKESTADRPEGTLPPPTAGVANIDPAGPDTAVTLNNVNISSAPPLIFTYVEQMPRFPAGGPEDNAVLTKYLLSHLRIPEGTPEGRVIVRFVVMEDGTISSPTVLRGLSPAADSEALRLIGEMPPWQPGKQNGRAVNVYFTLPVYFGPAR